MKMHYCHNGDVISFDPKQNTKGESFGKASPYITIDISIKPRI